MIRVCVVVEGATEESFVKKVLAPAFWAQEIFLNPIIIGRPGHKGGNTNYQRVSRDVVLYLKQDQTAYCSMMLDFYGLGESFPGTPAPANLTNVETVRHIEDAVKADICNAVPGLQAELRFLPYLQLHEFEALLFSDPTAFANGISRPDLAAGFQQVRDGFETPEDIDDSPDTAPSKRILAAVPKYKKVIQGSLAAQSVGIDRMKEECPHFAGWLDEIAALKKE